MLYYPLILSTIILTKDNNITKYFTSSNRNMNHSLHNHIKPKQNKTKK